MSTEVGQIHFGHHMSDGSMFAELASYSSRSFAEGHQAVLLQTPTEKMKLTVIAADVVDTWNEFKQLDFEDDAAFKEWQKDLLKSADMVLDPDVEAATVKAFCTCSYGPWNGHERTITYAIEEG